MTAPYKGIINEMNNRVTIAQKRIHDNHLARSARAGSFTHVQV